MILTSKLKHYSKLALKTAQTFAILIVCGTLGGIIARSFTDHEKILFLGILNVVLVILLLAAVSWMAEKKK